MLTFERINAGRISLVFCLIALFACRNESEQRKPAAERAETAAPNGPADPVSSDEGSVATRARPQADGPLQARIKQLQALGYVSGSVLPTGEPTGVTQHVPERTMPGLNVLVSGHGHEALLMNAEGKVLHTWRKDVKDAFPGRPTSANHFRRVYPYPNGDLLVVYGHADGLVKLDRCSNVIWSVFNGAHHDFEVQPNGDIYTLVREAHVIPDVHPSKPILEDFVVVLSPSGQEVRRVSLVEALRKSEFVSDWNRRPLRTGDVLHTNSVKVIDLFGPNQVLVSILYLDMLAVLDMDLERFVWAHTADFKRQHDAQLLPNGRILLFDNQGQGGTSRVLEIDPDSRRTLWEYPGEADPEFQSQTRGKVQRFPNGNSLISETDQGRAFEITTDGEIVWEYYNPYRAGVDEQYIAAVLDMLRLPSDFPTDWITPCPDR